MNQSMHKYIRVQAPIGYRSAKVYRLTKGELISKLSASTKASPLAVFDVGHGMYRAVFANTIVSQQEIADGIDCYSNPLLGVYHKSNISQLEITLADQ